MVDLTAEIHELLWSQWSELGVPGTNRRHESTALDPEPLKRYPEVIWHAEEPKENILQGYLLARPMPFNQFLQFLESPVLSPEGSLLIEAA